MRNYLFTIFWIILLPHIAISQGEQLLEIKQRLTEVDTTMFKYLSAAYRSQWQISKADSEQAFQIFNDEVPNLNRIARIYEKIEKGRLTYSEAVPELFKLLSRVKDRLEQALKLNPFDKYAREVIEVVYLQLDEVYTFKEDNINRIQLLKNLLHIVKDQYLLIDLYNQLGRIYRDYQLWEFAKYNFHQAVNIIFEGEESEIDSTLLFENIYYRGEAYLKLYQDEGALLSFERARMIAPTQEDYQRLTALIEYINWDQGNIRASEKFQHAMNLSAQKKYKEAEPVFMDLKKVIQTEKAKQEAQLELSIIQFNYLDKQEEAIDSLWQLVIKNLPLDSLSGTPINKYYWNNYGYMCVELANKFYKENRKLSFIYFLKTTQIDCPFRASAFLGLADLTINDFEEI